MSRRWAYQDERLCHGCVHDVYLVKSKTYKCNLVDKAAVEKYELNLCCPFFDPWIVESKVWIDEDGFYHVREEEQE